MTEPNELVRLIFEVDEGDRTVFEERMVPAEVAAAIERGDRVVLMPADFPPLRRSVEEERRVIELEKSFAKERLAQLGAEIERLEDKWERED